MVGFSSWIPRWFHWVLLSAKAVLCWVNWVLRDRYSTRHVWYGIRTKICKYSSFDVILPTKFFILRECELWCGISEANINVFSIKQSVVLECKTLCHFELANDTFVSLLNASKDYVYSYVSPGSTLYQWNNRSKTIKNRLDCSKLVPCSESLWSISIEENLSPGKCQVKNFPLID